MKNKRLYHARNVLALLFSIFFLAGGMGIGSGIFKFFQLCPVISSFQQENGFLAAGIILGVILLLTLLFGRFYCSFLCPLGLVQELFSLPFKGKKEKNGNAASYIRLPLGGILWGIFLADCTWSFWGLDPFTLFMRGFAGGGFLYILPLFVFTPLFLLVLWKGRFFCNSLCPAGALLGGISKFALFPLQIHSGCIGCGKCRKMCPAGSITGEGKEKKLDPASCVLCMACVGACPVDAVSFGKKNPSTASSPSGIDGTRRGVLKNASLLASGLCLGGIFGVWGKGKEGIGRFFPEDDGDDKNDIFPPGAITGKEFLQKCLSCQLCAASCPGGIIRLRENGLGGVELDYNKGFCIYDCHICMQVCPAGALKRLPLREKKRLQIGKLLYDPRKCIVLQESEDCGKCADVCPAEGILLRKVRTGLEIPKVVPEKCIGCGRCLHVCPSSGALKIVPLPRQNFTKEIQKKEEL